MMLSAGNTVLPSDADLDKLLAQLRDDMTFEVRRYFQRDANSTGAWRLGSSPAIDIDDLMTVVVNMTPMPAGDRKNRWHS